MLLIKSRRQTPNTDFSVSFDGDQIKPSDSVKILGVTIDSHFNLSWESHVGIIVQRCNCVLIGLARQRHKQWRLVALKVPEARTQCPTIVVFTTPVGFDTHLWASILQNVYPFRERSFPLLTSVRTTFCFHRKLCQIPTFSLT